MKGSFSILKSCRICQGVKCVRDVGSLDTGYEVVNHDRVLTLCLDVKHSKKSFLFVNIIMKIKTIEELGNRRIRIERGRVCLIDYFQTSLIV